MPILIHFNTKSINPSKRLAMALRYYATGAPYTTLADGFGVGITTFRQTVHEVTELLISKLTAPSFPTTKEQILRTASAFDEAHEFPDVLRRVDGSHIPIVALMEHHDDYWCYKKFYSIILIGVCDTERRFTYFNIGSPGREPEGGVYKRCALPELVKNFEQVMASQRYHILGDSAFALTAGLMKPFPQDAASECTLIALFNYQLS